MKATQQSARIEVESSNVSSVGYDEALAMLEIEFRNGRVPGRTLGSVNNEEFRALWA